VTDYVSIVDQLLDKINSDEQTKHIKTVVIDTLNGLMVADEVRRMKEKGYDKWQDLAQCVWNLLDKLYTLRDNLTVIIICHSQTQKEDDGYTFTRIKTSGKKLDKLNVESKLTTVLYATVKDGQYVFQTHANNSTAKTPLGAFEDDEIENDIVKVLAALKDY
jgi:archaellum biogenesis ATPase FlaH